MILSGLALGQRFQGLGEDFAAQDSLRTLAATLQAHQTERSEPLPDQSEMQGLENQLEQRKKDFEDAQRVASRTSGPMYPWSQVVRAVYASAPEGVAVYQLNWNGDIVTIYGAAMARDSLLIYSNRLQQTDLVNWVDVSLMASGLGQLPVQIPLRPGGPDIAFTMVLSIKSGTQP